MRLDRLLANMGYGSRKEVKQLVKKGKVTLNNSLVKDVKKHVDPTVDVVVCNGQTLQYKEHVYFMMNKPKDVITATKDDSNRTVLDLLKPEDKVLEPFPVGRLDKDTEGLLLITNDGQLAHELLNPKKHVNKRYLAVLDEPVDDTDIEAFSNGLSLKDGYITKPAELMVPDKEDPKTVHVHIQEGKYHQIKRMFGARNNRVLYLKRLKMGPLSLDDHISPGEYRSLTASELDNLMKSNY